MTTLRSLLSTGAIAALLCASSVAYAFDVPPNDGFVTDSANILTADQKQAIEAKLTDYRTSTSNEIAVVTIPSLGGEPIEDVGLQIARKWGVGSTKNNGILILVAYEEHEVRFDVGYGLEGAVPDIVAKGIIDTDIVPHFRDGDYAGGITAAIDSLEKHIGGEYTADRYAVKNDNSLGFSAYGFFIFFILLQWAIAIMGRTKSWWLGGVFGGIAGLVLTIAYSWWVSIPILILLGFGLDYLVSKNYNNRGPTKWWAGGGWGPGGGGRFGGGGGGGFGGFGGGGFGGGGASGKW